MGADEAQASITAFWDQGSAAYDAQPGHGLHSEAEHRAWLAALAALLPPAPADVLDVGTGTGFLAWLLAELGHRVIGMDLAEGMLRQARAKTAALPPGVPAPQFRIGDAVEPPLPPGTVDVVVSRHVLWTLPALDRAFANWRRLLRPGGWLVAIDGLWQPPARSASATATPEPGRTEWDRRYTPEVQAELPLFGAPTHAPAIAAAAAAGFVDVRVLTLEEVDRAEREVHPQRAQRPPHYVLSAQLPAVPGA